MEGATDAAVEAVPEEDDPGPDVVAEPVVDDSLLHAPRATAVTVAAAPASTARRLTAMRSARSWPVPPVPVMRCTLRPERAVRRLGHAGGVTYCLALRLDSGLLFLSDTRTNAGVDNIGTFRKLHVINAGPDRAFVVQAAGSLATTHEVLARVDRDLGADDGRESLPTVAHQFEPALYLGPLRREVAAEHVPTVGTGATATFILGGQIGGQRPDILLVYPEGNYIRASDTLPYLQIGESKYGKFLLELAARTHVDVTTAGKLALASMLSTVHANLSVGPPYDTAVYRNGSFVVNEHRIEADHPYLTELTEVWVKGLRTLIDDLPPIPDDLVTKLA